MSEELKKLLNNDTDGLMTYEYMANHINEIDPVIDILIDQMISVDMNGQFLVSAARYLSAIDSEKYKEGISRLIAAAIDKDREHKYIGDLLTLWGDDYESRLDELNATDNNFRRIYKRLFPTSM